jgi:hypothetical protein
MGRDMQVAILPKESITTTTTRTRAIGGTPLPSPAADRVIDQQKDYRTDHGLDETNWQQTIRMPRVPAKELSDVKGEKGAGNADCDRNKAASRFIPPNDQLRNRADD